MYLVLPSRLFTFSSDPQVSLSVSSLTVSSILIIVQNSSLSIVLFGSFHLESIYSACRKAQSTQDSGFSYGLSTGLGRSHHPDQDEGGGNVGTRTGIQTCKFLMPDPASLIFDLATLWFVA